MKKAAIITFTSGFNYGNRLQNYAVQEILKDIGFDVVTIRDDKGKYKGAKRVIKDIVSAVYGLLGFINISKLTEWERKSSFERFNRKYLKMSNLSLFEEDFSNKVKECDYYFTGSDQVWNPYFIESDYYFLTFAPQEKRIAFSASIGVDDIPDNKKDSFKIMIGQIPYVSVREEKAAEIINNLGLDYPTVLVDPTLALDKEKWQALANSSKFNSKQDYIFVYFLGPIQGELLEQIQIFADKKQCRIVNPLNTNNREEYSMDPSDFIKAIKDAKYIITDSFHGTVFSIIFDKQFIVYDRKAEKSMGSRIDTLLKKFGLSDRAAMSETNIEELTSRKIDYSNRNHQIDCERIKVYEFLKKATSQS